MSVDWFTLAAQAINFLVLVWLLKRLFYDRIIGAMDAREAGIASRLDEAARARAAAESEAQQYRASSRDLEQQRGELLERARQEAEVRRRELLEEARLQADRAQQQWLQTIEGERQGLLQDFRERVGRSLLSLASKGLKELADADLEAQVLKVFGQRLRDLDSQQREAIAAAVRDSGGDVEVHTSFALDGQAQDELIAALREELGGDVQVRFDTDAALICGIELRAQAQRLAWSLDSWLETLEERVFETLDENVRSHAAQR